MEIEAKLRLRDEKALKHRLGLLRARYEGIVRQHDVLLDFPDGRLRKNDELVRVREQEGMHGAHWGKRRVIVTYKGGKQKARFAKKRVEKEAEVAQRVPQVLLMLREMGLLPQLAYEKYRERYLLQGAHVEIDYFPQFPKLGKFVEIEGRDEKRIAGVMKALGLKKKDLEKRDYAALVRNATGKMKKPGKGRKHP